MGGDHSIYEGAHSLTTAGGFTSDYELQTVGYSEPASSFGLTTHPQNANVLKEVSDKINSGIKAIEITAISPNILEAIPQQHLDEIRRLKELTGVELTFHGPIVEASGIDRGRFDPLAQKKAEREMFKAVESAQRINQTGNTIVTFHSASAGLPELETYVKGKEGVQAMFAYSNNEEGLVRVPIKPNFLEKKEDPDPKSLLKEINERYWEDQLNQASAYATRGKTEFETVRRELADSKELAGADVTPEMILNLYKKSGTPEGNKILQSMSGPARQEAQLLLSQLNNGDLNVRQAYNQLQSLFNQAWINVDKGGEDWKRLNEYRNHLAPLVSDKNLKSSENVLKLADEVSQGLQMLSTLELKPEVYSSAQEAVIKKSAETFSNVAFNSFKKFGKHAPIISIENPPAGSSQQGAGGLSRGEDVKKLVEATQREFVQKIMNDPELQISKEEAEHQAQKLIGVTWDVGHINMIRQFGYDEKDVVKETEKVAQYVKHVHLSDNFGINHTELPMGMGNVPTKEHLELIAKYNKQAKKIIETGDWWNHFKRNPFPDTLQAFGSPVYAMKMSPYWNQARGAMGSYFSGFGMNPDHHHQIYGSGFTTLPVELGGQMSGRNRLSGAPMG